MMDDEITECPLDSTQEEGACRSSSASSCPRPAGRKTPARPADSFAPGDGRGPRGPLMSGSGPPGHKPPRRSTVHVLGLAPPRLKDQSQGARAHNRPSHRSGVRPFFCCGSELSLVSLMDSVDLNGPSHGAGGRALVRDDKHSLSDSEDAAAVDFLPHGGYSCHSCQGEDCCGDDYGAACGSGASIQTVCGLGKAGGGSLVRRVKSDKRKPKKHFWSLRFGKKGPAAAAAAGGAAGGGAGAGAGAVKLSEVRKSVCGQCGSKKCHASQQGARCQKGGACGCRQAYRCLGGERRAGGGDRRASVAGVFPISGTDELLAGERSLDRTATRGRASCDMSSFMDHIRETPLSQLASRLHRLNPGTSLAELTPGRDPFEEYSPLMELHGADFVSEDLVEALVHTRVDFVHHLVPDLNTITGCSFYWGVMDRYEAERLLDQRREGTFLLRDSAQDDFLFSVSFRRYNRSLHARIEQWNHRFSFDIHDPAVYSADSVCGLIEHYKDSSRCMFFEPMLTEPLHRSFPFSLQHLARAVVCNRLGRYDHIARLPLPTSMKAYLRYYHYKQKVCVRSFEDPSL